MVMPAKIAELRECLNELQQEFAGFTARFETIWADSMIDIRQDPQGEPQANWKRYPKFIFYDFKLADDSEKNAFMGRVANDLMLQDLALTGNLAVMQDTLKIVLAKEFTFWDIQENIEWGTISQEAAFYLGINAPHAFFTSKTGLA
jgi:hypothetical protein